MGAQPMNELDSQSPHQQTALAMAALAVAFADTLQELLPNDEALVILQRKVQVAQAKTSQNARCRDCTFATHYEIPT
jgi:hypothetical protein